MINERQKQLYELLVNNEGKVLTKAQIIEALPGLYSSEEAKDNSKWHNILDDVKAINRDPEIEKILIYKSGKIGVANEEQAEEYKQEFLKKAVIQFANYHALNRKIKSQGQGVLNQDKATLCDFIDRYVEFKGGTKKIKI